MFIAKHQNSKIVCVDPQTGDRVNIDSRLNLTVKGMTEISIINNLKPSKYINGCVRRRKDDKQKNDQNSKIVCVDPQTGDRVNIDSRLNLTVKGMTEISIINNLKPSKYINGCVRRRKDDKQKNDQNSSNRSRKKN